MKAKTDDACSWKRKVSTWAEGEAIIARIISENIEAGMSSQSIGLAVYRCGRCSAYHVGHSGSDRGRRAVRRAQQQLSEEQRAFPNSRWLWRSSVSPMAPQQRGAPE